MIVYSQAVLFYLPFGYEYNTLLKESNIGVLMGRKYYLKDLIESFDLKWIRFVIKAGKDSGYPPCCITFFFVRLFFMDLYGILTGDVGPFKGKVRTFYSDFDVKAWQNSVEYKRETKHVACPWHRLIYFLTKKEHHYYNCGDCSWIQFENDDCNNCAQDDFYQTKARRRKSK